MKTIASLLLLIAVPLNGTADSFDPAYAQHGQLIVTQFVSAPFPHPSRAEGRKYKDQFFPADKHYADRTVALFLPKGFRATERVDFVVHFHGWHNTVAGTLRQFQLIEQLVASGRNAVLIVPEGPHNAPDSAGGKLEDPDGFQRFMAEAVATLRTQSVLTQSDFTLGDIILSGHSGGYKVMAAILDRGGLTPNVKEVWLFDALYAETDKFLAWADRRQGRLINIYTDGGGTKDDSEAMMAVLRQRGRDFLATEEATVTAEALRTNTLVFLHTDLGHNDVLAKRKEFELFLRTSCLRENTK
jgi:hypothetical protein